MIHLKQLCPEASCVYVADAAHFPYGTKTAEQVAECASRAVSLVIARWNPDVIVIACNTISVSALDVLRAQFPDVPLVGTVPAIKLAASVSKNRRIGLLATEATVRQEYTVNLEKNFAADCSVFVRGDTALVDFIEHRLWSADAEERLAAVTPAVEYFRSCSCDTIVLGCTHFVHMAGDIAAAAGSDVTVVDSRDGVARQALKVAAERSGGSIAGGDGLLRTVTDFLADKPADCALYITGAAGADGSAYAALSRTLGIPWGGVLTV